MLKVGTSDGPSEGISDDFTLGIADRDGATDGAVL